MPDTFRVRVDRLPVDVVPSIYTIEAEIRTALSRETPSPWLCTFVNPASQILAQQQPDYAQNLHQFNRVLPDGIGITFAIRLLYRTKAERISFDNTSLAPIVFRLAAERGLTVAICGGAEEVAEQAAARIKETFGIKPLAFDGYAGLDRTVDRLLDWNPHIVVIGMGAPLQEAVLLTMVKKGWYGVGFTCGGYLDQLAQRYHYYPAWVDRWNLRFAYRLYQEPERLWRRYLLQYPQFLVWLGREMATRKQGR